MGRSRRQNGNDGPDGHHQRLARRSNSSPTRTRRARPRRPRSGVARIRRGARGRAPDLLFIAPATVGSSSRLRGAVRGLCADDDSHFTVVAHPRRRAVLPLVRIELRGYDDAGASSATRHIDTSGGRTLYVVSRALWTRLHRIGRYGRSHCVDISLRDTRRASLLRARQSADDTQSLDHLSDAEWPVRSSRAIPRETMSRMPVPPPRRRAPFLVPTGHAASCPAPP